MRIFSMRILWITAIVVCILAASAFAYARSSQPQQNENKRVVSVFKEMPSWTVKDTNLGFATVKVMGGTVGEDNSVYNASSASIVIDPFGLNVSMHIYKPREVSSSLYSPLETDNPWIEFAKEFLDVLAAENPGESLVTDIQGIFEGGHGRVDLRTGEDFSYSNYFDEAASTAVYDLTWDKWDDSGESCSRLTYSKDGETRKLTARWFFVDDGKLARRYIRLENKDGKWEFGGRQEPSESDKAAALALLDEAMERYPWPQW